MTDFLKLPERQSKPRNSGLTHVIDKGLGRYEVLDLIETAGVYVDIVKLGFGTGYVIQSLQEKIKLYQDAGIPVYLGGTLFEIAVYQGKVTEYCRWVESLGISMIEISNGIIKLLAGEKREYIKQLSKDFRVISEVGSKDPTVTYPPQNWADWVERELEAGAELIIAEGRESGNAGIYDANGNLRVDVVEAMIQRIPQEKIIFEVANRKYQTWFIKHLGSDVNLGNIQTTDVIALETLRLGLRSDTFDLLEPAVSYNSETILQG